ncbi:MAG: hypothetical protein NVS1B11_34480 [Terriglobales bacterium]
MPLTSGTKFGPYEVQSLLGAGGMGEVYRARDTRLDRTVAIKVLASHLSSSPELKQRMDREARAISSLNHPHICHLYDIGSQESTDYLVMEFLEGETLAERLLKGPLPLNEALKIGIAVAEALAVAQRQGDCAPQSEAREHYADERRRKADGLWASEIRGRRRSRWSVQRASFVGGTDYERSQSHLSTHDSGHDDRDYSVHVPGAD